MGGGLLLLFLLGWFAREQWAVRTGQVRSLAVLPFTALTPMPDGEQLGIGLADALITRLSNTGGLIVRPTSAILKFTAADRDSIALARRLEVDAILDGRLQRDGEQLRLTVQLLRAGDGKAFRPLTPKAALKRVMKYYGNGFYRVDARQRTIESYEAAALSPASAIAPGEERRGILFFETLRNSPSPSGLTLSVFGATPGNAPLNIKLN